jgi:putative membrane protein insertion efficiency factor
MERLLWLYKRLLSPLLHAGGFAGSCRFQPTCSEYAAIAIHTRGALRGSVLAFWRLLRCHPFSRGGFDPVPASPPAANSAGESSQPSQSATLAPSGYHRR